VSKSPGMFVFHFKLSDSLVMTCRNVEHLGGEQGSRQGRDRVIISTETTANTLASFQS
jgi:hypothetical protein